MVKLKPTHILYVGHEYNKTTNIFKDCLGKLYAYKKNAGKINTRNPLNQQSEYYDGYIYEIDLPKLSTCYK